MLSKLLHEGEIQQKMKQLFLSRNKNSYFYCAKEIK